MAQFEWVHAAWLALAIVLEIVANVFLKFSDGFRRKIFGLLSLAAVLRSDGIFLLFLAVLWLLFIVKLARQAERQGTDSLTREQLAELPRDGGLPVAFLWLGIALIILQVGQSSG